MERETTAWRTASDIAGPDIAGCREPSGDSERSDGLLTWRRLAGGARADGQIVAQRGGCIPVSPEIQWLHYRRNQSLC